MKKQLFVAALLVAAMSFVGCDPQGNTGSKVTGISVSPKSVVLNDAEPSIKLAVKYTPADAKAEGDLVWTSSDTTVATVTNKGFVEAVAYGECTIYVQYGELIDSCQVEVKTFLESLVFTGACYLDLDTAYYKDSTGAPVIDTLKNGKLAYPTMITWAIMSDGFYVNNSGKFDGPTNAALMEFEALSYYAPKYLNDGQAAFYVLGQWMIKEDADGWLETTPGTLDEEFYMDMMKQFVAAYVEDEDGEEWGQFLDSATNAFSGPYVETLEYNQERESYLYANLGIHDAICTSANIYINNTYPASDYMCGIDYCEITFKPLSRELVFGGFNWGINIDATEEDIFFKDEEVHFDAPITSVYGTIPAESQKLIEVPVPAILEHPELKEQLRKSLEERNVRVFRKK